MGRRADDGGGRAYLPLSDVLKLPDSIESVPEGIAFWAEQTPDALALRATDWRELTHAALQGALVSIALQLAAHGISRGDRVAIILPSGFEMCLTLLGTMFTATAVPLYAGSTAQELSRDLERLSPALILTGGAVEPVVREVAGKLGQTTLSVGDVLPPLSVSRQPALRDELPQWNGEDVATILHTSGTTGLPKRAPRPHRTFVATARIARESTALTPDDVALVTAGLHTNAGVANVLNALLTGGTCVIAPGSDPAAYPAWLAEHRPTWTISNATELNLVLAAADSAGREMIAGPDSRLRIIRAGAQPMTPGTVERVEERFRALVMDGYGMTEASYITASGPTAADRREGSCGLPTPGTVRSVDQDGEDLAAGSAGEIVIRGPTLFPGYLDDPQANAAAFLPGGWFRTGDIGYLDADGFLFLSGRRNELINRGGEKIAPVEVDRVLLTHPAVAEAAAFPVPDPRLGEDIVAAIVLKPGQSATPRTLRGWMLDRLSPFKVPRRIWFVERLPRTVSGKVQRGLLSEQFAKTLLGASLPREPTPAAGAERDV